MAYTQKLLGHISQENITSYTKYMQDPFKDSIAFECIDAFSSVILKQRHDMDMSAM
jgi:hypothetical protein